ncbi:MAG: phosphate signaling complex protein PhoU [Gammaproteobacteria bacterium]
MGDLHLDKHISRQFNKELEDVRNRVLAMGGVVEQLIAQAVRAVVERDGALGKQVIEDDDAVNDLEIAIDEECSRIIARRQPAASDLRMVMMVVKTITDLERIGDEAEKIGWLASKLAEVEAPQDGYVEIENLGNHVRQMVRDALDAFARMDSRAALKVASEDPKVDREYEAILRQQITYMMEDARNIRRALDVMWAARALERIGDHARNIGEYVIYLVEGKDVRHISIEQMTREVGEEK